MKITLRDYQNEAVESSESASLRGIRRQLIALPTSTGKTIIFSEIVRRRGGRALILVHRDELAQQSFQKLSLFVDPRDIGIVKASLNETDARVVIGSVQTLSQDSRLQQFDRDAFECVVCDEAHHSTADTWRKIIEYFRCFEEDGPLLLGATATPFRQDKTSLAHVFQEIIFQRSMIEMMISGYTTDLRAQQIRVAFDFHKLRTLAGDFVSGEVGEELEKANAPQIITQAYQEFAEGKKTIVFVPTVRLAHLIAAEFRKLGYSASALDANTDKDTRRDILKDFKSGDVSIVVNCNVLSEGFDESTVECIFMARPTKSKASYIQMIGRGNRIHANKKYCLILDLVGCTSRHDLMTVSTLFDLDEARLKSKSVLQVYRQKIEDESKPVSRPSFELTSHSVDIFSRDSLRWLETGNRSVLAVGREILVVEPSANGYTLYISGEGYKDVLAVDLPQDYCFGLAEDHARKIGAQIITDKNAAWRSRSISPKQASLLRRYAISFRPDITSGEASDLITSCVLNMQLQSHTREPQRDNRPRLVKVCQ